MYAFYSALCALDTLYQIRPEPSLQLSTLLIMRFEFLIVIFKVISAGFNPFEKPVSTIKVLTRYRAPKISILGF